MDWTVIITSIIGMISAIAVAIITHGIKKNNAVSNEVLQKKLDEATRTNLLLKNELSEMRHELDDNNLRTLRLDLLHAIETDPDNVMIIMEMAQKYFVDMHGNCYMSRVFQKWANEHNVNITGLFNKD